jgi:hypothetical protein
MLRYIGALVMQQIISNFSTYSALNLLKEPQLHPHCGRDFSLRDTFRTQAASTFNCADLHS